MTGSVLQFVILAATFSLLYRVTSQFSLLDEAAYRKPVLAIELIRRPHTALVLLGPSAPALVAWPQVAWQRIDPDDAIRPVLVVLCAGLAFFLVRSGQNRYFRRSYALDRALLVTLALLSMLHPWFALLTISLGVPLSSQMMLPLCLARGSVLDMARHRLPFPFYLLMFEAWLWTYLAWGNDRVQLLTLFLVGFGSTYFWSAIGKLRIDWLRQNELVGALNTAVSHLHWPDLNGLVFRTVHAALIRFNGLLCIAIVAIELSAILLCVRYELTLALLGLLCVFQLAVSMITGINFRSWSLVAASLAYMTFRLQAFQSDETTWAIASSLVIMLGNTMLFPLLLAWLDTRLCNVVRFHAIHADGSSRLLHPRDFGPYEVVIDRDQFEYLTSDRVLVSTWGEAMHPAVPAAVRALTSAGELAALEGRLGVVCTDPPAAERFDRFIRTVLADLGAAAPRAVSVRLVKYHYRGRGFHVLEDKEVRRIELAPAQQS